MNHDRFGLHEIAVLCVCTHETRATPTILIKTVVGIGADQRVAERFSDPGEVKHIENYSTRPS